MDIPLALSYDDVLLIPQYSEIDSRSDVDLSTSISPKVSLKIPLISSKMDTITGVTMAIKMSQLGGLGILPRFEFPASQADKVAKVKAHTHHVAAALGCKNGFMERAEMLVNAGADIINVDVAHGHMKKNIDAISSLRQKFNDNITIIAGITSTYQCAVDLYKAGADCLLVGVGAGSTCTTRIQTGFGVPSITSLLETARAAKEFKKTFGPDAGIRNSGDIVKALATGASAICGGYIFAGTDEAPGDTVMLNGKKYKRYNGSASSAEKNKHVQLDPSDKNTAYTKHVEGISGLVSYRGPVEQVIDSLLAGVRSGLGYAGAKSIPQLWEKAKFIRITPEGLHESNHHDVILSS